MSDLGAICCALPKSKTVSDPSPINGVLRTGSQALLRVPLDRLWCGREGGPASPAPRLGEDNAGHLRAPMAGHWRVDANRCRAGHVRTSCGLPADQRADKMTTPQVRPYI